MCMVCVSRMNPTKTTNKQRVNLMLSPDARKMLKKLASLEKRSRSNLIEVLIQRENERQLQPEAAK